MKLLTGLLVVLILAAGAAHAQSYSAIYAFGDNLTDTGNLPLYAKGSGPGAPYDDGRYSNGPLWVEDLAASLNLSATPGLSGGTNFALANAQLLQAGALPSIAQVVSYYLNLNGGHADPNALYIIQGGINDARAATPASAAQLGMNIAAGLAALESQLRAAGAAHFLIVNLPDVGLMPAASSNAAAASLASSAANIALKLWVANEQLTQGVQIASLDLYTFSGALKANPAHYGFTNDATPCLSASLQVCADPSQTYYWDGANPTAAAHAVLGQLAQAQLMH